MARRIVSNTKVEADFTRGMIRDVPRHAIPPGGVYAATDFLLHQPGVAQKRGGTTYVSPALGDSQAAHTVFYAPFPGSGAAQLLAVALDSVAGYQKLYKITDVSTATSLGQYYGSGTYLGNVEIPKLWIGGGKNYVILGGAPLQKYDGTTLSLLGPNTTVNANGNSTDATITVVSTSAFPSTGIFWVSAGTSPSGSPYDQVTYTGKTATTFTGCSTISGSGHTIQTGDFVTGVPAPATAYEIYKSHLVVGGVGGDSGSASSSPNRSWFSPIPNIEAVSGGLGWDLANSYIDSDYPIVGYAALSTALLIFNEAHTERLVGSTPPPNSDMDRAVVNGVGCTDARSIVVWNDQAIYANPRGVYMTNGASQPVSLTAMGGIDSYWRSLLSGYVRSTWKISCGIFRDFLFVSVKDNSALSGASGYNTLVCYLPGRSWALMTNMSANSFSSAIGVSEELYAGFTVSPTAKVVSLSGLFLPTSSNKNDADGTAVAPMLETRLLGHGPTLKQFSDGHLSYDMRDAASDNPTMAVSVAPGLLATTYSAIAESPLAETTDVARKPVTFAQDATQGISLKFQQTNASSKTEIYGLEYDERPLFPGEGA